MNVTTSFCWFYHRLTKVLVPLVLVTSLAMPVSFYFVARELNTVQSHKNAVVLCTAINEVTGHITSFVVSLEGPGLTVAQRTKIAVSLGKNFKKLDCDTQPIQFINKP